MSKILKISSSVRNSKYSKSWNDIYDKQSRRWKIGNAFAFGGLFMDVPEPAYIKNPRIAEIFEQSKLGNIRSWHIENGYFYIEVVDSFEALEGEVYE